MFLLSKIAVGKSFCVPLKTVEKQKVRLPDGFDSIYIYNEDQRPDIFRHEYILFEQLQALPCYIIQFEFDLQRELSLKVKKNVSCSHPCAMYAKTTLPRSTASSRMQTFALSVILITTRPSQHRSIHGWISAKNPRGSDFVHNITTSSNSYSAWFAICLCV